MFFQVQLGTHKGSLVQISSDPQEVASWAGRCKIWVYFQISWTSEDTLPLWSMCTQQLELMTVHIPRCDAKTWSSAIRFCKSDCDKFLTSSQRASALLILEQRIHDFTVSSFNTVRAVSSTWKGSSPFGWSRAVPQSFKQTQLPI